MSGLTRELSSGSRMPDSVTSALANSGSNTLKCLLLPGYFPPEWIIAAKFDKNGRCFICLPSGIPVLFLLQGKAKHAADTNRIKTWNITDKRRKNLWNSWDLLKNRWKHGNLLRLWTNIWTLNNLQKFSSGNSAKCILDLLYHGKFLFWFNPVPPHWLKMVWFKYCKIKMSQEMKLICILAD